MLKVDIQPYVERIINRELSNRDIAAIFNVSEEHVSRTLKALGIKRIPADSTLADRRIKARLRSARQHFRITAAKTLPPELAAQAANCSLRTIYRYKKK